MTGNEKTHIVWNSYFAGLTPKQVMQQFRKDNGGMVRKIQTVRIDWPDAIRATSTLVDYVSAGLVDKDTERPLIYEPMRNALQEYTLAVSNNATDIERLSIYLRVLLAEAADMIAKIKVIIGEDTIWYPESGIGLNEAKRQCGDKAVSIEVRPDPQPERVCIVLSESVLTNGTKYVLEEVSAKAPQQVSLCSG